jgi:serine/threonine protein phosphatase 1
MKITNEQLYLLCTSQDDPIEPDQVWAIGDTHGCFKTLKALIKKLNNPKRIYILGDYLDRGPNSKGIMDLIMKDPRFVPLMGNHEDIFLKALKDPKKIKMFIKRGGQEVLDVFGVETIDQIPKKYIKWIKSLPYTAKYKDFLMSHAGVNIGRSIKKDKDPTRETKKNVAFMLYNRAAKAPKPEHGIRLIVGHTPKSKKQILASLDTTMIYIDGGAGRGGPLVAYNLDSEQIVFQKNKDFDKE